MSILITGGAGYIGSHTCVELLEMGYDIVVVDNLSNSSKISLERVEQITGKKVSFHQVDLLDKTALNEVFEQYTFEAVIHFAGLKAVGESVQQPGRYYHNNVTGSLILFEVMIQHNVKNIVFSSSATVYGDPHTVPITEDFPLSQTNPYGTTKYFIEKILIDIHNSDNQWNTILLRYFNPVGAHPSGLIGEDPNGIPNNLMPFVSQVAVGKLEKLSVFGADYETPDGTGVRDYIHILDLARGHLKSLEKIQENPGIEIFNLGTGQGYSVFEIIKAFEKASGKEILYEVTDRRAGDIATCYADPTKASSELNWNAEYGLDEMCTDAWRWQSNNLGGYKE